VRVTQADIDFESVHSEWRLWIRGYRDDPPSNEEIALVWFFKAQQMIHP
jgi:hypothetical protein